MATLPTSLVTDSDRRQLQHRRQGLMERVSTPILLWAGAASPRNFAANTFPFRASSHFLYFAGLPLENAVLGFKDGESTLFMDKEPASATLWHGASPHPQEWAELLGVEVQASLDQLKAWITADTATIAVQDVATRNQQAHWLQRSVETARSPHALDLALTEAVIDLRLCQDSMGLAQMETAAEISMAAHRAGMESTRLTLAAGGTEAGIRSALESVFLDHDVTSAYTSIVTVHGEVLHNNAYHHVLRAGDLLLVDAGAETKLGWAADITRTWPVSGQFSPTQKAIYEVVLGAHDAAIAALQPGVEYERIHLLAAEVLAAGLVDLGILRGNPEDLVETDAHSLFFPHGIGHLLGLDVHDMEDLGDRAGYAPGRSRSDRFGLGYLRLNRPLQTGMVVTIEPGFYQVPALLADADRRERYREQVNWERLEQFADVRGIRIEDDVRITAEGAQVLTAGLPTTVAEVEAIVQAGTE